MVEGSFEDEVSELRESVEGMKSWISEKLRPGIQSLREGMQQKIDDLKNELAEERRNRKEMEKWIEDNVGFDLEKVNALVEKEVERKLQETLKKILSAEISKIKEQAILAAREESKKLVATAPAPVQSQPVAAAAPPVSSTAQVSSNPAPPSSSAAQAGAAKKKWIVGNNDHNNKVASQAKPPAKSGSFLDDDDDFFSSSAKPSSAAATSASNTTTVTNSAKPRERIRTIDNTAQSSTGPSNVASSTELRSSGDGAPREIGRSKSVSYSKPPNISSGGLSVKEAVAEVRNDQKDTDWMLFNYDRNTNDVVFDSMGSGGHEEFVEHLDPAKSQFALLRIITGDRESRRVKFVFIAWNGPSVQTLAKAKANTKKNEISDAVGQFHISISAEDYDAVQLDTIKSKLKAASGADYDQGNKGGYESKASSIKAKALENYRSKEKEGNIKGIVFEKHALPSTTPCDLSGRPTVAPPSEAQSYIDNTGKMNLEKFQGGGGGGGPVPRRATSSTSLDNSSSSASSSNVQSAPVKEAAPASNASAVSDDIDEDNWF